MFPQIFTPPVVDVPSTLPLLLLVTPYNTGMRDYIQQSFHCIRQHITNKRNKNHAHDVYLFRHCNNNNNNNNNNSIVCTTKHATNSKTVAHTLTERPVKDNDLSINHTLETLSTIDTSEYHNTRN